MGVTVRFPHLNGHSQDDAGGGGAGGVRRAALGSGGLMLLLLLLSAALRFHNLGAQSLWYDEGVAYTHALRRLDELLPLLQRNVHGPGYFALLGLWEDVAGHSEFALRLLSAFFSILSVAWVYALGRRLFHPLAGLAAALVALNTFSIYYAQEARMYAMLAAVAGAAMWIYAGLFEVRGRLLVQGLLLGGLNAIGIYTHVAYALVLLAQGVLMLPCVAAAMLKGRRAARRRVAAFVLAGGVMLLLFLPWLEVALRQVFAQPNISAAAALDAVLRVLQGHFAFGVTFDLQLPLQVEVTGLLAVVLLLWGSLLPKGGERWWGVLLPMVWVAASVLCYLYLELTTRYIRFLLPAQLAFALWMGRGVWMLGTFEIPTRRRWLRLMPKLAALSAAGTLLLALTTGLEDLYHHSDLQRDDVRGLVRQIEAQLGADDALLVSAAGVEEVLRYYYTADAPIYGLPTAADDELTRRQVLDIIERHHRLYAVFYGAAEQDPNGIVEATVNRYAYEIRDRWVGDMRFVQYVRPFAFDARQPLGLEFDAGDSRITLDAFALSARAVQPGDVLQVQLVWSVDAPPLQRYKVFLQLLDADGFLAAQRDSEPAGGSAPTTGWQAGQAVVDNHALLLADLPRGEYALIAGLYALNDPAARLSVGAADYAELARIQVG